jgi:hypothetical protein
VARVERGNVLGEVLRQTQFVLPDPLNDAAGELMVTELTETQSQIMLEEATVFSAGLLSPKRTRQG